MPASTRFAVAVHVLVMLAHYRDRPLTSERLAESANTNPAVIRRLLGSLADAGFTRSQLGVGGGTMLARPPQEITLREIYQAVERSELIATHRCGTSDSCPVGAHILPALQGVICRAERAFVEELDRVTLADITEEVEAAAAS